MRTAGFTLVEVLVALFIFGLLSAGGAMVLGGTLRNQTIVEGRLDRLEGLQRARALLRADLAQAAPDFRASPGLLIGFTRRGWDNPQGAPRASLQRVTYRLRAGRLERLGVPLTGGEAPPQVLMEGVESAEVLFLRRGDWLSAWTMQDELPEAVRLRLRLRGAGEVTQDFLTAGQSR